MGLLIVTTPRHHHFWRADHRRNPRNQHNTLILLTDLAFLAYSSRPLNENFLYEAQDRGASEV